MKKALLSALLAAAFAAAAGAASAFADVVRHERVLTSGKSSAAAHKTVSRVKKVRQSPPAIQNNVTRDDDYTAAREQMIKSAM